MCLLEPNAGLMNGGFMPGYFTLIAGSNICEPRACTVADIKETASVIFYFEANSVIKTQCCRWGARDVLNGQGLLG